MYVIVRRYCLIKIYSIYYHSTTNYDKNKEKDRHQQLTWLGSGRRRGTLADGTRGYGSVKRTFSTVPD